MEEFEVKLILISVTNKPNLARETLRYLDYISKKQVLTAATNSGNTIAKEAIEKAIISLEEETIIKLRKLSLNDAKEKIEKMSKEERGALINRYDLLGRELEPQERTLYYLIKM